jgi:hypothetical protein
MAPMLDLWDLNRSHLLTLLRFLEGIQVKPRLLHLGKTLSGLNFLKHLSPSARLKQTSKILKIDTVDQTPQGHSDQPPDNFLHPLKFQLILILKLKPNTKKYAVVQVRKKIGQKE